MVTTRSIRPTIISSGLSSPTSSIAMLPLRLLLLSVAFFVLLTTSTTTTTTTSVVQAYSSGPGGCPAGMAATNGGHVAPQPTMPTFAQLGYEFLVNSTQISQQQQQQQQVVDPTSVTTTTTTLTIGQPYEIAVRATKAPFRGVLIRFGGEDEEEGVLGELTPAVNAREAELCTIGIGHYHNLDKQILSGVYRPLTVGQVTVDVTIVQVNSDGQSVYSYEQYQLAVVDDDAATGNNNAATLAPPVEAPMTTPMLRPTLRPTITPTSAPTAAQPDATTRFWHTVVQWIQLSGDGGWLANNTTTTNITTTKKNGGC